MTVDAIVFDLDGVLIDSEGVWAHARERVARESGGRWHDAANGEMLGMSSTEWSRHMRDRLGVPLPPERISAAVADLVARAYRKNLPLLPGAVPAVEELAARWPLAVASSANLPVIDLVLELTGLTAAFAATVSSEEVARGKPAPDVYVEACARLEVAPARCAAVEDSTNGLLAAHRAGLAVIAIPRPGLGIDEEALDTASLVLASISQLTPDAVVAAGAGAR
jgi:HAD superfamily hydrolase (TIGR01509 family)